MTAKAFLKGSIIRALPKHFGLDVRRKLDDKLIYGVVETSYLSTEVQYQDDNNNLEWPSPSRPVLQHAVVWDVDYFSMSHGEEFPHVGYC